MMNKTYSVRKIEYRSTGETEEHNEENYIIKGETLKATADALRNHLGGSASPTFKSEIIGENNTFSEQIFINSDARLCSVSEHVIFIYRSSDW